MTEVADELVEIVADELRAWDRRFANVKETAEGIIAALAPTLEAHRIEGARAVVDAMNEAIGQGYPWPREKVEQCEHGKFKWEDCISCYDEFLTERLLAQLPGDPSLISGEGG